MKSRTLLTTLAMAALLVPTANARIPDEGGGMSAAGIAVLQTAAAQHPDNRAVRGPGGVVTVEQATPIRPDDRPGRRGPGAFDSGPSAAATHPDNRADARGPGAFTTEVVQRGGDSFDWGDAVIGGIGGVGLGLLLTGGLFIVFSQRQRTRMA
jgi:hypothetical protein